VSVCSNSTLSDGEFMTDILFLVVTVAFFAVCVAYTRKLDRI
jgi:hypothetical protein